MDSKPTFEKQVDALCLSRALSSLEKFNLAMARFIGAEA